MLQLLSPENVTGTVLSSVAEAMMIDCILIDLVLSLKDEFVCLIALECSLWNEEIGRIQGGFIYTFGRSERNGDNDGDNDGHLPLNNATILRVPFWYGGSVTVELDPVLLKNNDWAGA